MEDSLVPLGALFYIWICATSDLIMIKIPVDQAHIRLSRFYINIRSECYQWKVYSMDGDECWCPSKNTESFLAWWQGNANKDKIHNDWFHNSFLSLVLLSGPTFEGVVRRSIKDRCQMLLRGSWAERWRGGRQAGCACRRVAWLC